MLIVDVWLVKSYYYLEFIVTSNSPKKCRQSPIRNEVDEQVYEGKNWLAFHPWYIFSQILF